MPIEIETPDGVAEFPDGTPDAVIERALRESYSSPQQPPQQQRLVPRGDTRQLPWQQMRSQTQAAAIRAERQRTGRAPRTDDQWLREGLPRPLLPFARDLERFNRFDPLSIATNTRRRENALRGLQSTASDVAGFFKQTPGDAWGQVQRGVARGASAVPGAVWDMVSHPAQTVRSMTYGPIVDGGQEQINLQDAEAVGDDARANMAASRANSSLLDAGINVGGLLVGGGAANTAREAATRGVGAFARQTAQTAGLGATIGGGLGFLRTPGDLENRTAGATEGAGVGGTIGAVAPAAINTARLPLRVAGNAARNLWDRIPVPENARSSVGMGGRPMRRAAPGEEEIPQADRLAQMFERARIGGDDLEAAQARAEANPQGEALVDLAGDTGVRTLRPVVQSPGETGALAQEFAAQRFGAAPRIVSQGAREGLGVRETPAQARARLEDEYNRIAADLYEPIWENPITPTQRANLASVVERYQGDRVFNRAMRRAEDIFQRDRRNRVVRGRIEDNFPRYLHYLKMGLDAESKFQATPQGGASGQQLSGIREMRAQVLRAIDDNVPRYREARSQWGGLHAAEEAISTGRDWLRSTADEVSASRRGMSEFEVEHARIGLAEEIRRAARGNDSGTKNAAGGILNDPDALAAISEAFETPEQAAHYIEGTIRTQRRLMSNASQWGGGAQTYSNAAFGVDGAVHALRAIHNPIEGGLLQIAKWLNEAGVERANDQFGRAALRRVDNAESRGFVRKLAQILRRRAAARAAAEASARAAAANASAQRDRPR